MTKRGFPRTVIPGSGNYVIDANSGGMAFLEGQLELIDPKLREPLASTWWPRDIVAKTGGGFVEYTSSYDVSYATTGSNQNGIIGGQTNNIPIMQADINKDTYKVFTWGHILQVPYVDNQKLQKIGHNLDEMLNRGLKLNYDKTLDMNVYKGFAEYGTYGLINNPNVVTSTAQAGTSGKTSWESKTPDEILLDINNLITYTWTQSEYDLSGMANHILLPPKQYTHIANQKVSDDASKSILTYLLENNIGANQGIDVFIAPLPFLKGAGTGGTDRMIGYVNDEEKIRFSIPVPLTRSMVESSVKDMAYLSSFISQFGEVEFLYYQPVTYVDGI